MGVPGNSGNLMLVFRAFYPFTLDSVTVYPGDTGWVKIADVQWDFYSGSSDTIQAVYRYVEPDSAFAPVRIGVGMSFEPGFHGLATGNLNATNGLLRTYENLDFPYVISDVVSIDESFASRRHYYWFYDWKISYSTCIDTNRYEVTAHYEDSDLPLPNDEMICQNEQLVVVPTTTGGNFNAFLWMDGSTGASYTATEAGTVSVVGTSELGCMHEDFMLIDTFPATPTLVPNDTTICDTDQVALPVLGGGLTTLWTFNGSTVTSANQTGTYIQSVEDLNGCSAQDTFVLTTIDCDTIPFGVDEEISFHAIAYPNPSSGMLNIQVEGHRALGVQVLIGSGQLVLESHTSSPHHQIDLSRFAKGLYTVELNADGLTRRLRWVLQ